MPGGEVPLLISSIREFVILAKIGIAVGVCVSLFVIVIAAAAAAVTSLFAGGAGSTTCTPTGSEPGAVAGYGPEQISNAATIVAVGTQMNVPEHGWVVALATAIQESGLRNLDRGDRDSLGLFQQRPSQGWGSPEQIMDPSYSATQFYQHLLAVPDWQQMSVNDAAQTVQRSGFPHAYGGHEPAARQLLGVVHGAACTGSPARAWTAPVQGQCTSGFGPRDGEFHRGQDIAAPIGTPIVAAGSGTVIDSGPAHGYGLYQQQSAPQLCGSPPHAVSVGDPAADSPSPIRECWHVSSGERVSEAFASEAQYAAGLRRCCPG